MSSKYQSLTYRSLAFATRLKPGGHHVGAADCLDLLEDAEFGLREELESDEQTDWHISRFLRFLPKPPQFNRISRLVEVADDFVEEPNALESLLVDVSLLVELLIVGDLGKHDGDVFVALAVQCLQ